jgi:hypothetical protein
MSCGFSWQAVTEQGRQIWLSPIKAKASDDALSLAVWPTSKSIANNIQLTSVNLNGRPGRKITMCWMPKTQRS